MPTHTITWKCEVCDSERPDQAISVEKRRWLKHGIKTELNVRYCNDTLICVVTARHLADARKEWTQKEPPSLRGEYPTANNLHIVNNIDKTT